MNTKNILFSLGMVLVLLLTLTFVSAERPVNYTIYYGVVEDDGSLTTSTTPVNDSYVTGYNCASSNCLTIGTQVTDLTNYTSTNGMIVTFPTTLNTNGYVLYFYKAGYIGWEQKNISVSGPNNTLVNAPTIIYLSKKRNGFAPIMNLTVADSIPQNTPIRVGLNVSIDATTYSAIMRNAKSNIPLNESVQTLVTVSIVNSSGTIATMNQTLNINYSASEQVNFTFSGFNSTGSYSVVASTQVTDAKILNSTTQTTNSAFSVIQQNLTNYTSTVISGLSNSPTLPRLGDNVTFSFNYVSGYMNESGVFLPANTTINLNVTRDGVIINNTVLNLNSSGFYSTVIPFNQTGNYVITISGSPNDSRGNQSFNWIQSLTFVINQPLVSNPGTPSSGGSSGGSSKPLVVKGTSNEIVYSDSLPLSLGTEVVDLSPNKDSNSSNLIYWIIAVLLILIIAIIAVYFLKVA